MVPMFVTLKDYDRSVVNKYGLYLLLGVIINNLVDYISICTDAEFFISFCRNLRIYICIYIVKVTLTSARCDTVFHIRR